MSAAVASLACGWAAVAWCRRRRAVYEAEDRERMAEAGRDGVTDAVALWADAAAWQIPFGAVAPETVAWLARAGYATAEQAEEAATDWYRARYSSDAARLPLWPLVCMAPAMAAALVRGPLWAWPVAMLWAVALVDRDRREVSPAMCAAMAALAAAAGGASALGTVPTALAGIAFGSALRDVAERTGMHGAFGTGDVMLLGAWATLLPAPRQMLAASAACVAVMSVQLALVRARRMDDRVALAWTAAAPVTLGVLV